LRSSCRQLAPANHRTRGRIHWAGEHTAYGSRWITGAVESGRARRGKCIMRRDGMMG
jgi:monoamine oxidase